MKAKIANLVLGSVIVGYSLLYIVGTVVAVLNKDIVLTAMFFAGLGLVGGTFFGRWTEKKDRLLTEQIMR